MSEYELTGMASPAAPTAPMDPNEAEDEIQEDSEIHRRTLRKLDLLLLPFLALLFLFNALDKSNIGNAESAHFTRDVGLRKSDLNTAVAVFFAFFVALQPLGAALGRKYGMVPWVPSCMLLWGMATALHTWIQARWQLYTLRILIGCLEAGFYPVTVTYLSLFYTRFEFGRRLSLFYGQAAFGGAVGGFLSYIVFVQFPNGRDGPAVDTRWHGWQALFLLEGTLTIIVALAGYFWLPHSVETAWFLTPRERQYASARIVRDRMAQEGTAAQSAGETEEDREHDEESHGLLNQAGSAPSKAAKAVTNDRGLSPHDVAAAVLSPKIWHILFCNILSAVPVYAFQVFLPLVLEPLVDTPSPALVNLLTVPPNICGAFSLYMFARYSDKHRIRLKPVLAGLAILVVGLILVVLAPATKPWVIPRYLFLNVLFAGTFIASPLTVAWISGNTPSPGKRALLLGINGWGNLAGVLSAMLFRPKYAESGYIVPFWWTLACVAASAVGYVVFYRNLKAENEQRRDLISKWDEDAVERENLHGQGPLEQEHRVLRGVTTVLKRIGLVPRVVEWLEEATEGGREGDEKITFVYGL